MKFTAYLISAAFFILMMLSPVGAAEKLRVGVVQFEEKNNIGLENAGVIIPEIVVPYLKQTGVYELSERVLLSKALEEQALQMTGITEGENLAKVGQVYNLDAIVTGSCMKIGNTVTISGRVINVENGDIIAGGTVKFSDLAMLEKNLENLAWQLSGTSSDEFKRMDMGRKLAMKRYGLRLGVGYGFNDSEADPNSEFLPTCAGFFYYSDKFDFDLTAVLPPAKFNGLGLTGAYNLSAHFGVGAAFVLLYDGISGDNENVSGAIRSTGQMQGIGIGVNYRATDRLRIGFYPGLVLGSEMDYKDENDNWADYEDGAFYEFPASIWLLTLEYYATNRFSAMLRFTGLGAEVDLAEDVNNAGFEDHKYFSASMVSLMVGYSFAM